MSDLLLWNSISRRRRSPSDDFLDNGLAILESFLEAAGYRVELVDWARGGQWRRLTPRPLARLNRYLAARLFAPGGKGKPRSRLLGLLFLCCQELMSFIQERRRRRLLRALARRVRDGGFRVVGIKTWYGDAFTGARYFARQVRRLAPDTLLVAGGPHASIYREALLEAGEFDVVVAGEGERALAGLLALARQRTSRQELLQKIDAHCREGRLVNVIYNHDGRVRSAPLGCADAARKVLPTYDDLDGKTLIHVVVDALGCPWGACSFCVHSAIYPRHTVRPPEAVVDEIERMLARGIGIFRFAASTSSLDHVRKVAELMERRALTVVFSMFGRVEPGAAEPEKYAELVRSYRTLLRAGLRALFLGMESGSDLVNRLVMNKGIRRQDALYTMRALREAAAAEGLPLDIGLSLIFPAPTLGRITLEELARQDLELVAELEPDSVLISPAAPFPGTAWFRDQRRYGFQLGGDFVRRMLEYDYVLYKPPSLWPRIELRLEGRELTQLLAECQRLREAIESRGIATEVTDEHFLILRAAGFAGREGVEEFKRQALLDIISGDYRWIDGIREAVNQASRRQAGASQTE